MAAGQLHPAGALDAAQGAPDAHAHAAGGAPADCRGAWVGQQLAI